MRMYKVVEHDWDIPIEEGGRSFITTAPGWVKEYRKGQKTTGKNMMVFAHLEDAEKFAEAASTGVIWLVETGPISQIWFASGEPWSASSIKAFWKGYKDRRNIDDLLNSGQHIQNTPQGTYVTDEVTLIRIVN